MTRLYLVRHGEKAEGEGTLLGHTDVALSARGHQDVHSLAQSWADEPPVQIIASDLLRTVQSAEPLCSRFDLPLATDSRLREMHFGEWEGKRWAEVEASHALEAKRWGENWFDARVPGGESYPDVAARASAWLSDFLSTPQSPTVVYSHSGTIRALLCVIFNRPLHTAFDRDCTLAHVHTVEWRAGQPQSLGENRADFRLN